MGEDFSRDGACLKRELVCMGAWKGGSEMVARSADGESRWIFGSMPLIGPGSRCVSPRRVGVSNFVSSRQCRFSAGVKRPGCNMRMTIFIVQSCVRRFLPLFRTTNRFREEAYHRTETSEAEASDKAPRRGANPANTHRSTVICLSSVGLCS